MSDQNTIQPNKKKVLIISAIKALIASLGILALIVFMNKMDIFGIFFGLADDFNVSIEPTTVAIYATIGILLIAIGYVIYQTLLVSRNNIQITNEALVITTRNGLNKETLNVPLNNVQSLTYDDKSIEYKLLKMSSMTVALTAMSKEKVTISLIEHPDGVCSQLQNTINQFRARMYQNINQQTQETAHTQRVSNIMDDF